MRTIVAGLGAHSPLRHLRISVDEPSAVAVETANHLAAAPTWFVSLVSPDRALLARRVELEGGAILIVADPGAEIDEAWRETRVTLGLLLLSFVAANIAAFVFLGRALKPLREIPAALEGVQRGRYSMRLPPSGIPEIDAILVRFNDMNSALERSEHDNRELARRSLAIQEDERRHFAHELHDELGQSITAIKALAVSIEQRADSELGSRAATIAEVCASVQGHVRRMMTRLHPVVLDELGLVAAIVQMVDEWNAHHEAARCECACEPDAIELPRASCIAIYRIVQEALTNVARHADADRVRIEMRYPNDDQSTLSVVITDNGRGFDTDASRPGLGLRGIAERVKALDGSWTLDSAFGRGTRVEITIPLEQGAS